MRSNMARVVVRFAALAAITALVNVGVAAGEAAPKAAASTAAPAAAAQMTPDGFHNATRLGGARALIGPIRDLKQLKRDMARPRVRKIVVEAMDAAGLSQAVKRPGARHPGGGRSPPR